MSEIYLYCRDMGEVDPNFKCCDSCHYEWEMGYGEPMIMELEKNVYVEHCCGRNTEVSTLEKMQKYFKDKAAKNE